MHTVTFTSPTYTRSHFIQGPKCFNCREKGPLTSTCPTKALFCSQIPTQADNHQKGQAYYRWSINGVYSTDIVAETGASKTFVRGKLVTPQDLGEGEITIRCTHAYSVIYPLASVKIALGRDITVQVVVADMLPVAALFGWDIPGLMALINRKEPVDGLIAIIRQQTRKTTAPQTNNTPDQEPAITSVGTLQSGNTDGTQPGQLSPPMTQFHIPYQSIRNLRLSSRPSRLMMVCPTLKTLSLPHRQAKPRLTRAQKHANNRQRITSSITSSPNLPTSSLNVSVDQVRIIHGEDQTLKHIQQVADGKPSTIAGYRCFRRNRLLYRTHNSPGTMSSSDTSKQLVLPVQCYQYFLKLEHNISLVGHLGQRKTTNHILQCFYWPGVFHDVSIHCRCVPNAGNLHLK